MISGAPGTVAKSCLIVGNGVSGNALAIALLQRGHDVHVLGSGGGAVRGSIGEHLPPEALPLLQSLGIEDIVEDRPHLRSPGLVSNWVGNRSAKDYAFALGGDGRNLDRDAFDARLRAAADAAGARRLVGIPPTAIRRAVDGWVVAAAPGVKADLVVDATGRPAALARHLGARRLFLDSLIALAGHFGSEDRGEARLLVESAVDGWWYALRQAQGRGVAVYLTGAERCPAGRSRRESWWRREYAATPLAGTLGSPRDVRLTAWDARTMVLLPQAGPGWMAVGDAAMAFDPISAAGITKALADARTVAALVSGDGLADDRDVLDRLLAERRRRWRGFVAGLKTVYCGLAPDPGSWWSERRRWAADLDPVEPPGFSSR